MNMHSHSYGNGHNIDQRRRPRTDVYCRIPIHCEDGRDAMATIVNISADGALVRLDPPLIEGQSVELRMPVIGTISGSVVWWLGARGGIMFHGSIADHDYNALLRGLGARPGDI